MHQKFCRVPSSKLWEMIALGVAELAQRKDDPTASPRVEIRRINGGQPQATITVAFQDAQPRAAFDGTDIPPLLCIGNATLNQSNLHHFEAIPVSKKLVAAVNRRAYRESSSGVL
jgi:hypothetical protein